MGLVNIAAVRGGTVRTGTSSGDVTLGAAKRFLVASWIKVSVYFAPEWPVEGAHTKPDRVEAGPVVVVLPSWTRQP
ncbi:hypothetical protein AB0B85_28125 [Micromonospora sp. NPDC049044]|uniref:hypothetical protein n=1 Tax=Micromonospora sp. NPDC049044 TaxID=3154827 RepID=UPI0033D5003B